MRCLGWNRLNKFRLGKKMYARERVCERERGEMERERERENHLILIWKGTQMKHPTSEKFSESNSLFLFFYFFLHLNANWKVRLRNVAQCQTFFALKANDPSYFCWMEWSTFSAQMIICGGTAWHRGSVRTSHPAVPGSNLLTAGRKSRTHLSLRTCSANFVR